MPLELVEPPVSINFERFEPPQRPAAQLGPSFRISQACVHLNSAAVDFLGEPPSVGYLLEPADRLLAVVAVPAGRPGYKLRRHSANTWLASARSLIKANGLPISGGWLQTFPYESLSGGACLVAQIPTWKVSA